MHYLPLGSSSSSFELVITTNFDKTRVEVLNFVVILGRLFVHSNKQMMILKPCYSANAWFIHKASHGIGHPSFPPPQSTSLPLFLFQHLALSAEMHADDRYEQSTFGRPVVYCSSVDTSIGDLGRKLWSRTTRSRDSSDSGIWPGIIGCRVGMWMFTIGRRCCDWEVVMVWCGVVWDPSALCGRGQGYINKVLNGHCNRFASRDRPNRWN